MPGKSFWECTVGSIDLEGLQDRLRSLTKRKLSFNINNLLGELGDDLLNLLESGFDSFTSQMLANLTNLVPNAGLLFISALTSGQQAYLGFHAFVYALFKYELQRRILIMRSLLASIRDIEFLVDLLLNSKIYGSSKTPQDIETAYKYIKSAQIKIGEATNSYNASKFYHQSTINFASNQLLLAKTYLKTPVLDTIGPLIRNANFGNGWVNASMDAYKDPQDMWAALVGTDKDMEDFIAKIEGAESRSEQERINESRALFQNAVLEYLELPITVAKLEETIIKISKQLSEDLPLNITGFYGSAAALAELGNEAKFEDLVEIGNENKRPFLNLNKSIKYRFFIMSLLGESWDGMISLKEFTGRRLDSLYKDSTELESEVREYIESPSKPSLVPIKLADWKLQIDSIYTRLKVVDTNLGSQTGAIENANKKLDVLKAHVDSYIELYDNGNKYTPEADGAFYLIVDVLTQL